MGLFDSRYFAFYTKGTQVRVPYDRINLLEYGQKVDRRLLMAVVISPMFLLARENSAMRQARSRFRRNRWSGQTRTLQPRLIIVHWCSSTEATKSLCKPEKKAFGSCWFQASRWNNRSHGMARL